MGKHQIHPKLLGLAEWRLHNREAAEKAAFAPPGDPAMAGGAPPAGAMPPDPMAAGAMPPDPMAAGAMPPDPMAAGAMPADPMAAAGGAPPGGGAMPPEIQAMIDQAVQTALAANGAQGSAGGAGAGPGAGGTKKIDPGFMYMELARIRKMLTNLHQHSGIPLPDDILDDQTTAQALMDQPLQSQPTDQPTGGAAGGGAGLPGIAGQAPITPIEPAKTAAAILGENDVGQPVTANVFRQQGKSLQALAALARGLNQKSRGRDAD